MMPNVPVGSGLLKIADTNLESSDCQKVWLSISSGSTREIGAIWPRKKGGGILRLDHMPIELTRHQGVLFVSVVEDRSTEG